MPNFYNFIQDGLTYSFDDVFVPADAFRQGNLWVWGWNAYGQLGINNIISRSTPVTTLTGGANWKQVAGGGRSSAAIKTDGTLWTWGSNYRGELGINDCGTTLNRTTPVTTFAGGTNWKQVSCAYSSMAAIKTDGTLWVWGFNGYGQLGINNTTSPICTPVTTFAGGTNWKQVSCSSHFSAIKTDGTLWTWGRNGNGQLGDNTITNKSTPVTTFAGGSNWKQVAGGVSFTAAIKTDGTLWAWGLNYGNLGNNTTPNVSTPVTTFAGGTNWKQVTCGNNAMAAIKTDGTLWTWGATGNSGILGINDTTNRLTPVTTFAGGNNWKQISAGRNQMSSIKTDGTLWIWGYGVQAGIGDNTVTNKLTPVTTFIGGNNWKQTSPGGGHTVATTYIDDYQ